MYDKYIVAILMSVHILCNNDMHKIKTQIIIVLF